MLTHLFSLGLSSIASGSTVRDVIRLPMSGRRQGKVINLWGWFVQVVAATGLTVANTEMAADILLLGNETNTELDGGNITLGDLVSDTPSAGGTAGSGVFRKYSGEVLWHYRYHLNMDVGTAENTLSQPGVESQYIMLPHPIALVDLSFFAQRRTVGQAQQFEVNCTVFFNYEDVSEKEYLNVTRKFGKSRLDDRPQ